MLDRTLGQIIVVADYSKWGVVSNFQIAVIDEIDIFVTDESLDESAFESLEKHSVKSMIAKAGLIND